jgi:hypothetical protein
MLKSALGAIFLIAQLSGPGGELPQVLHPDFKASAPVKAGKKSDVTVSFSLLKGYAINRTPPMTLKLTTVSGLALGKTDFTTSSEDPKSKDEYYAELPSIKVPLTASKPGAYEIPAKLTYFFCSKTDGFCSRQVLDMKIPVQVQ